jgi:GDP-L-fucose synthase
LKVFLTGAGGMLGRSIVRVAATHRPDLHLITPSRDDLDLTDQQETARFFRETSIDAVIHAAARVGGIQANIRSPADFYIQNTLINTNVIDSAYRYGVEHLINIGSSCMYPKDFGEVLKASDLLAGPLEPTNEAYALSKITAAKYCEYLSNQYGKAFRTLLPSNLYGPHDDFSPERSHLVAAVIAKVVDAKTNGRETVTIWGDGSARREFLYVDDLARFIVDKIGEEAALPLYLNVGAGVDHTVNEYHHLAADIIGYDGGFVHDLKRPVGMKRKLLDSSLAQKHGWQATTTLRDGIAKTYAFYQEKLRS